MARRAILVLATLMSAAVARAARAESPPHVVPVTRLAPGERRPVLFFLHGLGGSGADALGDSTFRAWAETFRVHLVAPDGAIDHEGRRFWNAGGACCNFDNRPVDDVYRLERLIDQWRERPDVDPARVFVVGFSNGGFMAHRLACWMDDRLAAVVSVGGAGRGPEEACGVRSSISVAQVHGDADPIVHYGGGRVFGSRQLDPHPSAPDTIRQWAARLDCTERHAPRMTQVDLDPRLPGAETTIESRRCPRGTVELWTVHGGQHQLLTADMVARIGGFLLSHPKPPPKPSKP